MPKINNPLTGHGKMIIRYKGHNELLKIQPEKMKRIYMHRSKEVQPDLYENLIIETELFDGSSVCFSLCSGHLYNSLLINNEKKWVRYGREGEDEEGEDEEGEDEEMKGGYGMYDYVNIDNQQVVFEGNIGFYKEICPEFISYEFYDFFLFFNYSKDLLELLDKNEVCYTFHS